MPRAIPVALRQVMIDRHLRGVTLAQIAADLHLSRWTVRAIWRRYQHQGAPGLLVHYARCGPPARRTPPLIHRAALVLRQRHPGWGAHLIGYLLAAKWPQLFVPTVRTLHGWFRHAGLTAPRRHLPAAPRDRTATPHAVWQMDAVEQIRLADGSWLCWLTVTDEASGAILAAELFPQRYWSQVPVTAVREAVRRVLAQWGLPARLRVDNGAPWGSPEDLPPAFALWLIGLGVGVIWNRPHHPQENGRVERTPGVLQQWAELDQCPSFAQAQVPVAWAVEMQREHYPAVDGQSRLVAYPGLRECGRPYDPVTEEQHWEEQRVYSLLEQGVWPRQVSQLGQVSLYGWPIGIGMRYRGQTVVVRFAGNAGEWVFTDTTGQELTRRPAPELSRERILALDVARTHRSQNNRPASRAHRPNDAAPEAAGGIT